MMMTRMQFTVTVMTFLSAVFWILFVLYLVRDEL